jgi:hypothetical protein
MKNLAQELKRKRDAEARLRQTDPAKNVVYTGDGSTGAGGGGYSQIAETFTKAVHDAEDHTGLTGVPLLSSLRQSYVDTDTIVVAHAFGRRPLVQVVGGATAFGAGVFGAGVFGGGIDRAALTPSSIIHDTVNQVTVVLSAANTGEVICIG